MVDDTIRAAVAGNENKIYPSSKDSNSSSSSRSTLHCSHQVLEVEPVVTNEDQHLINLRVWNKAKDTFHAGKTLPYAFRLDQLRKCKQMLVENEEEILQALYEDLRKPRFEAILADYDGARKEILYQISHLKSNMKPSRTPYNFALGPFDNAFIKYDPYGVVLILGVWNYPISLVLSPLFGAIAAGNCVIVKPSEIARASSKLLKRIITKYLDRDCYQVIETELEGTIDLLKLKFDYIFATGSIAVGKSIMKAAAEHLTPVTLELGGKSPVYMDESTNVEYAIKRVLWGKCINLGQACIAPDYLLCSKEVQDKIVQIVPGIFKEWFGEYPQNSTDLARIINEKHFGRLKKILDETKGKVIYGGDCDIKDLWICPTVLVDVRGDDISMEDEIFGPILPIVPVESAHRAIEFINARSKPLSLYLFSRTKNVIQSFKNCTSSGQLCINDVIIHSGWKNLPFGGVGDSGIGAYHDQYTFSTFSHAKAILHRTLTIFQHTMEKRRFPPHLAKNIKYFAGLVRLIDSCIVEMNTLVVFFLGIILGIILKFLFTLLFPCVF